MNVTYFKSQVVARASQAAKAFQLDKMAEADEYIQSEGLNVTRRSDRSPPQYSSSAVNHQDQPLPKDGEWNNTSTNTKPNSSTISSSDKSPDRKSYMMPSVASLMQQTQHVSGGKTTREIPHKKDASKTKYYESKDRNIQSYHHTTATTNQLDDLYDSDNDDESLSEEDSQITSFTPSQSVSDSFHTRKQTEFNSIDDDSIQSIDDKNSMKKKDVNRFLSDLDARLRVDDESFSTSKDDTTQQYQKEQSDSFEPLNIIGSFAESEDKLNWFQNIASPRLQQAWKSMKSATNNGRSNNNSKEMKQLAVDQSNARDRIGEEDSDEEIIVSSNLTLGNEEAAELERIRQRMNSGNPLLGSLYMVMDLIDHNKHYLGVFVTFVVTTFGYFLTRKADDGII